MSSWELLCCIYAFKKQINARKIFPLFLLLFHSVEPDKNRLFFLSSVQGFFSYIFLKRSDIFPALSMIFLCSHWSVNWFVLQQHRKRLIYCNTERWNSSRYFIFILFNLNLTRLVPSRLSLLYSLQWTSKTHGKLYQTYDDRGVHIRKITMIQHR